MAVAVSYTPATNIMAVTGGTSSVPALMIAMVQKDFDTPLALLSAAVIDANPDIMSLTSPVRARDSLALHLSITASANRAGATVDIIGRNHLGDSVTETGLDIATALTTAVVTANAFSQVYTVTFNGMTNGDAVTITQPRLGVITAGLERDVVVNGGFDVDASWNKTGTWSIAGGVATVTGNGSTQYLSQDFGTLTIGEYYIIKYSVTQNSLVPGTDPQIAFSSTSAIGPYSASALLGTHYIIAPVKVITATDFRLYSLSSQASGTISIDNVSVQKLTGQYEIGCNVEFGDGSTPTYFKSLNEMVRFDDGFVFSVKAAATLKLGELSGNWGINGSTWSIDGGFAMMPSGNPNLLIYGSSFNIRTQAVIEVSYGNIDIRNSTFLGTGAEGKSFQFWDSISSLIIKRINFLNATAVFRVTPDIAEDIYFIGGNNSIQFVLSSVEVSVQNINIVDYSTQQVYFYNSGGGIVNIIDPVESIDVIWFNGPSRGPLFVKYTINIHLADKNGADLEAATVSLTSFGNIVSNDAGSTFYRCIVGHTAGTFATDLAAGKWILTTAANAALAGVTGAAKKGAWVAGIVYTAAATEFSVATAANGNIAQQTVTYKKWIGTSEAMLSYSPHTLTIHKDGLGTMTMENIVVSEPIKYNLELLPGRKNIGFSGLNPVGSKGMSL